MNYTDSFRLNPNVFFCVDIGSTILHNREKDTSITICYPEAAIFDLLTKHYRLETVIYMVSKIGAMTMSRAEIVVIETIQKFFAHEVLIKE